mgnify:CR=1 FL=1
MQFEEITKTQKCYTIKNGKEVTIKVCGVKIQTEKVIAVEQNKKEPKWYGPKEYKNWFVKTKTIYVKKIIYI